MNEKFAELLDILADVSDLEHAEAVLGWDQQTYMPPGGAESRADQESTLAKLSHERFTSAEVGRLLEELSGWAQEHPYDSFEASAVRVAQRDYDQSVKLPGKLVTELSKATSLATNAWMKAKENSDFAAFLPHLERIVELNIEKAEALGYEEGRYDALLDLYEPEMKTALVVRLFAEMKKRLVPLVQDISARVDQVNDEFLRQPFEDEKQWNFSVDVLKAMGFDFAHGRQDRSEHPFTTSFSSRDVRLTTHVREDRFTSGVLASVHEGGHGLYEQGIPWEYHRTPLAGAASLGVHESQSRLWENLVGRSRGFWSHFYPILQGYFPSQLQAVELEAFYRALNRVEPSMIRIEADEVTYNLHIFIRFELEQDLVAGKLAVKDLPDAWNQKMEDYLGSRPVNDAEGVLQDVHWAIGHLGYFPTYSLGNLLSVQLFNKAVEDHPEIPDEIAQGRLLTIKEWMNRQIHSQGAKLTPVELVQKATGESLRTDPYLDYIETKYREIYDL